MGLEGKGRRGGVRRVFRLGRRGGRKNNGRSPKRAGGRGHPSRPRSVHAHRRSVARHIRRGGGGPQAEGARDTTSLPACRRASQLSNLSPLVRPTPPKPSYPPCLALASGAKRRETKATKRKRGEEEPHLELGVASAARHTGGAKMSTWWAAEDGFSRRSPVESVCRACAFLASPSSEPRFKLHHQSLTRR